MRHGKRRTVLKSPSHLGQHAPKKALSDVVARKPGQWISVWVGKVWHTTSWLVAVRQRTCLGATISIRHEIERGSVLNSYLGDAKPR